MRPINRSVKIQNDRPERIPKRPKFVSIDGGNVVVFVPRCKRSATAIAKLKGDEANARWQPISI